MDTLENAQKRAEYWKAEHVAANAEIETLRRQFAIAKRPPCLECGATSLSDADNKCRCGGDKDHCHGCELWPVD